MTIEAKHISVTTLCTKSVSRHYNFLSDKKNISRKRSMKYKVVSESAQETPIDNQDNPFILIQTNDINETKRKANKLGSAYF